MPADGEYMPHNHSHAPGGDTNMAKLVGYLAKYVTKSTEATGKLFRRIDDLTIEVHATPALQLAVELAAVLLHRLSVLLQVIDDEAHVMDAVEILAALVAGGIIRVEL